MVESEVTPLRKPWRAQMLLKCLCIVIQSATQAREGVILHLTVADKPKASQGSYEEEQPSSKSHSHPLLQHLPFSLGSCSILTGKYPECLQQNVKQRCPPMRDKSGSQITLQWPFHLFKQKWLKWKETGKIRSLHLKHTNHSWEDWKHEWQALLQEFRAKNLRNRPLAVPQGFLFLCQIYSFYPTVWNQPLKSAFSWGKDLVFS